MNETALILGSAIALGYYLYARLRDRIITKRNSVSEAREQENSTT
jgi:hypothetical protein